MRGAINKEERFMKKLLKSVAALSLSVYRFCFVDLFFFQPEF